MAPVDVLLIAYVLIGCTYWLAMTFGVIRIVQAVPVLKKEHPPEPACWPSLSVIVAACNEGDKIESAAATLIEQDYPDVEIILIDDRSTDQTGELIDRSAATDDRVRAVHVTELPDGWLGKVHALALGVEQAQGDWILFTDADVHYAPDALRKTVAWAEHRQLDHLATIPEMWRSGLLVDAAVSDFTRTFGVGMRCWAIEDPKSRAFIGVGAFNLVRRSSFQQTPGFEWLRLEVADDVGLGLMMKRSGFRGGVADGAGLVGLHWYRSVKEAAIGAEKAFASLGACSFTRMVAICLVGTALELAPWLMLIPSGRTWAMAAGAVMMGLWLTSQLLLARQTGRPIRLGLLTPLTAILGLGLCLRAAWLGWRRGGVLWRGTLYSSRVLREGKRVWLPSLSRTPGNRRTSGVESP